MFLARGPRLSKFRIGHCRQCGRQYSAKSRDKDSSSRLLDSLFKTPTWSTKSMLPSKGSDISDVPAITSAQLDHYLKLSALPKPKDPSERQSLLRDVSDQLHFVQMVKEVDTRGFHPLTNLTAGQAEDEELTYEDAVYEGDVMSSSEFVPEADYTKLASRTKNRYYTVDGGLVNEDNEDKKQN